MGTGMKREWMKKNGPEIALISSIFWNFVAEFHFSHVNSWAFEQMINPKTSVSLGAPLRCQKQFDNINSKRILNFKNILLSYRFYLKILQVNPNKKINDINLTSPWVSKYFLSGIAFFFRLSLSPSIHFIQPG